MRALLCPRPRACLGYHRTPWTAMLRASGSALTDPGSPQVHTVRLGTPGRHLRRFSHSWRGADKEVVLDLNTRPVVTFVNDFNQGGGSF